MKLRSHLIALAIASLLPVILFAGVMIYVSYQRQRAAVERDMIGTARALSLAVDRELEASMRTLEALAASEHLTSGDLRKFYYYAEDALKVLSGWENIALADVSGQQLLNSRRPFEEKLPSTAVPEVIERIIETRMPAVSDLFRGSISQTQVILIGVPVVREGRVRYVLASTTSPAFLATLLSQQKIPSDWIGAILDRNKIIIARTREANKFVGQPATRIFAEQSTRVEEGWFSGLAKDNTAVYTAFSRSRLSGWTIGLAIPSPDVEVPLRRSLMVTGLGGMTLLAGAITFAIIIGRRISRAATQLSAGARALGGSETPQLEPSPIVELDQVAREIEMAAVNRRRAEEAKFRALVEQSITGIYVIQDDRIVYFNPNLVRIFGYTVEELPDALPIENFVVEADRSLVTENLRRRFSGEKLALHYTFRGRRKDGSEIVCEAYGTRTEWNGRPAVLGTLLDVTERKRSEGALKESEGRKSAILESAPDCIVTMNHEGKVLEFNPAAERTFGYARAEVLGKEMAGLIIPPSLRDQHSLGLARYLATGNGPVLGKRIEMTAMRADGSEFPVELSILRVGVQEPPVFTGFIRDITERKRIGEELIKQSLALQEHVHELREAQQQAVVGRLAASAAHEVNNPLFAIKMQLSLLRSAGDRPESLEKYGIIADQLDRIGRATQSLLGFFRQRAAPAKTHSYGDVIRTVTDLFEGSFKSRGVSLVRNFSDSLPTVSGNIDGIQEVLINLLENAREATGSGQEVSVSAATHDHKIVIRVEDDGPGLGDDPEKLFKLYYTTKSTGTGLGLSIARQICEKEGGKLVAENRQEGGARFTISLPIGSGG
jgi:PAS domain S-box-containing protein